MGPELAGLPTEFPFQGRIFKVLPRTLEAELNFQTWLEREAYRTLLKHRLTLGEVELARRVDQWSRDCAAGVYEWGKEPAFQKLSGRAGQAYLLWLKIMHGSRDHKGDQASEEEIAELPEKDPVAWQALLRIMQRQDFPETISAEANGAPEGAAPNRPGAAAAAP